MRTALRNIGLRLWQYGQNTGSLVQKQLRAYIPQQLKEARLISSLLQGTRTKLFVVLNLLSFANKNTWCMTISMEMVNFAKSQPSKSQLLH